MWIIYDIGESSTAADVVSVCNVVVMHMEILHSSFILWFKIIKGGMFINSGAALDVCKICKGTAQEQDEKGSNERNGSLEFRVLTFEKLYAMAT